MLREVLYIFRFLHIFLCIKRLIKNGCFRIMEIDVHRVTNDKWHVSQKTSHLIWCMIVLHFKLWISTKGKLTATIKMSLKSIGKQRN